MSRAPPDPQALQEEMDVAAQRVLERQASASQARCLMLLIATTENHSASKIV